MLTRPALVLIVFGALVVAGCASPEPVTTVPGPTTPGTTGSTNTTGPGGTEPGNGTMPGTNNTMPGGNTSAEADVIILDNLYQPNQTATAPGASLTFRNDGQALHSVTIEKQSGEQLVDVDVDPGEHVMVEFPDSGTYLLRCKYHSADFHTGQTGVITVT